MEIPTLKSYDASPPYACLYNTSTDTGNLSLLKWESVPVENPPLPDVMNYLKRGSIRHSPQAGLTNYQAPQMTYDMFNGGCVNPHGCKNSYGYSCQDGGKDPSLVEENEAPSYAMLFASQVGNFEYNPPSYVMGVKDSGVNSNYGWKRDGDSWELSLIHI